MPGATSWNKYYIGYDPNTKSFQFSLIPAQLSNSQQGAELRGRRELPTFHKRGNWSALSAHNMTGERRRRGGGCVEKGEKIVWKRERKRKKVEQTWQIWNLWRRRGNTFRSSSDSPLRGMHGKCQQTRTGTHARTHALTRPCTRLGFVMVGQRWRMEGGRGGGYEARRFT